MDTKFTASEQQLPLINYSIVDVLADGNCAFASVITALNTGAHSQWTDATTLRKETANLMKESRKYRPDFIEMLQQSGFWNNGIDGAVSIEVLSYVAKLVKQPILVVMQRPDNSYCYWHSGTPEKPCDTVFKDISEKPVESILGEHGGAIKLFYNGIHFQAIVKNTPSRTPPFASLPNQAVTPAAAAAAVPISESDCAAAAAAVTQTCDAAAGTPPTSEG